MSGMEILKGLIRAFSSRSDRSERMSLVVGGVAILGDLGLRF